MLGSLQVEGRNPLIWAYLYTLLYIVCKHEIEGTYTCICDNNHNSRGVTQLQ